MTVLMSFVCNERSNVFAYREYQHVFEVKRRINERSTFVYYIYDHNIHENYTCSVIVILGIPQFLQQHLWLFPVLSGFNII